MQWGRLEYPRNILLQEYSLSGGNWNNGIGYFLKIFKVGIRGSTNI